MTEPMEDDEDFYAQSPAGPEVSAMPSNAAPTAVDSSTVHKIEGAESKEPETMNPERPNPKETQHTSAAAEGNVGRHDNADSASISIPLPEKSSLSKQSSNQHAVVDTSNPSASDQIGGRANSGPQHGGSDAALPSTQNAHTGVLDTVLNLAAEPEAANESYSRTEDAPLPTANELPVVETQTASNPKFPQPHGSLESATDIQLHSGMSTQMEVDENPTQPAADVDEGEAALAPSQINSDFNARDQPVEDAGPEFEADSSPYESSSDASSDSSSDESDDDYAPMDVREQARLLMEDGGSDDEGGKKGNSNAAPRTQNEQMDELVPMPDIEITAFMGIETLGEITTIVENVAVIKGAASAQAQVLDNGSLLCRADRKKIGVISEAIGRVEEPMYVVRFTNAATITDFELAVGTNVFYVPAYSTFLLTNQLKIKGSDASNLHDEEVGDGEIDFSDDEAEKAYKASVKKAKKTQKAGFGAPPVQSRSAIDSMFSRRQISHDDSGPTELSYDDNGGDDLYTPLSRPQNMAELMQPSMQVRRSFGAEGRGEWPAREAYMPRGRGRGGRGGRDRGGFGGRGRGDHGNAARGRGGSSSGAPLGNFQPPVQQQSPTPMPGAQWPTQTNNFIQPNPYNFSGFGQQQYSGQYNPAAAAQNGSTATMPQFPQFTQPQAQPFGGYAAAPWAQQPQGGQNSNSGNPFPFGTGFGTNQPGSHPGNNQQG